MALGLTQAELAAKMDGVVSPKTIPKYENGEIMPRVSAFIMMYMALEVSPNYFLTPFRPEIAKIEFRKPLSLGQRMNRAVACQVSDAVENSLNIEEKMGMAFDFQNPVQDLEISLPGDVERAANLLRETWRLGDQALPHVIATLEHHGIRTIEVEVDSKFDGLAGLVDGRLPFMVLNRNLEVEDKRFVALRELGQLCLSFDGGVYPAMKNGFSEYFARILLLPKEAFHRVFGPTKRDKVSVDELIMIRETFGIGLQSIMERARELGLIRQRTFKAFRKFMNEVDEGADLGSYLGKEEPVKVKQLVHRATAEGVIDDYLATDILNVGLGRFQVDFIAF